MHDQNRRLSMEAQTEFVVLSETLQAAIHDPEVTEVPYQSATTSMHDFLAQQIGRTLHLSGAATHIHYRLKNNSWVSSPPSNVDSSEVRRTLGIPSRDYVICNTISTAVQIRPPEGDEDTKRFLVPFRFLRATSLQELDEPSLDDNLPDKNDQ